MTHYQGRYRIASARLPAWDYSHGWYMVTICTLHRQRVLGAVVGETMHLSEAGAIAAEEWRRTGDVRANVVIDVFVVMPDHVHAIIAIGENNQLPMVGAARLRAGRSKGVMGVDTVETPRRGVSTGAARLRAGSLGAIVGQWKSVVTKRARAAGYTDFRWQSRYHDMIIRDQRHLDDVRRYIEDNPCRWHASR